MNGSLKLTPITTLTKRMAIVKNGQTFDCHRTVYIRMKLHG
jgi:hypothetical protein